MLTCYVLQSNLQKIYRWQNGAWTRLGVQPPNSGLIPSSISRPFVAGDGSIYGWSVMISHGLFPPAPILALMEVHGAALPQEFPVCLGLQMELRFEQQRRPIGAGRDIHDLRKRRGKYRRKNSHGSHIFTRAAVPPTDDSAVERVVMDTAGRELQVISGIRGHSVRVNVELHKNPPAE